MRALAALSAIAVGAVLLAACAGSTGTSSTLSSPATTTPGATLSVEQSPVGPILATGDGYTLYDFAPDTPAKSTCVTKVCVEVWPPLINKGNVTVSKGLHESLVSSITRADGSAQVTYGGHPLYTWKGDTQPGVITGQALLNAGGYWYVISPSGAQITTPFTVLPKS